MRRKNLKKKKIKGTDIILRANTNTFEVSESFIKF